MSDLKQVQVVKLGKKVPSEVGKELERLLSAVISKTTYAHVSFTNSADDFTESSKSADVVKITVKKDGGNSRFILRFYLVGESKIWLVYINFHSIIQNNIDGFFKELQKATAAVYEEENEKNPAPDKGDGPNPPSPDAGGVPPAAAMKAKRGNQTRTASIITDEMIEKILEKWMKHTGEVAKISQREFGSAILSKMGITIGVPLVVAFLTKKGIIKIIPVERKPIVELDKSGIEILKALKKKAETERLELEKAAQEKVMLELPIQALPALNILKSLQAARSRLKEIGIAEKNIRASIVDLQRKMEQEQKRLAELEKKKIEFIEKIGKTAALIDQEELISLIEKIQSSQELTKSI